MECGGLGIQSCRDPPEAGARRAFGRGRDSGGGSRPVRTRLGVAAAAGLVTVLPAVLGPSRAASTPAWVITTATSPDRAEPRLPLVSAGGGGAVVGWSSSSSGGPRAWAVTRPSGAATWSAAEEIGAEGAPAALAGIALDGQGVASALLLRVQGDAPSALRVAERGAQGWTVQDLASPPAGGRLRPGGLRVNARGDAVAVWEVSGPFSRVEAATRRAGEPWSAPSALEPASAAQEEGPAPVAAIDPSGIVTVVWEKRGEIQAARGRAGGVFARTRRISGRRSGLRFLPRIGVDSQGTTVVVWGATDPASLSQVVEGTEWRAGRWARPRVLFRPGGLGGLAPILAVGPRGDAVAVWGRDDDGKRRYQAAARSPRGRWGPFAAIGAPVPVTSPRYPAAAVGPGGGLLVALPRGTGADLARRAPGGTRWLAGGHALFPRLDEVQVAVPSAGVELVVGILRGNVQIAELRR